MRVPYVTTSETRAQYHNALNDDLGIYKVQSGAGIGGFLKKMFSKYVVPLGKTVLKQGYEIAKPELQKMGKELGSAAVVYTTRQVKSGVKRMGGKVDGLKAKMQKPDVFSK